MACARGMGGHMHLYAPEYLAASYGIVGSTGPAAAGFALAAAGSIRVQRQPLGDQHSVLGCRPQQTQ